MVCASRAHVVGLLDRVIFLGGDPFWRPLIHGPSNRMFHVSSAQCGLCTQPIDKRHFEPPVDSAFINSIDSLHSPYRHLPEECLGHQILFGHTCELLNFSCILAKLKGDLRCRRCMNPQYNLVGKTYFGKLTTRQEACAWGGAVQ
jgi:hypothetical protein